MADDLEKRIQLLRQNKYLMDIKMNPLFPGTVVWQNVVEGKENEDTRLSHF